MARHTDYIPSDKFELESWAKQFATTVTNNVGSYGITQELADDISVAAQAYSGDLITERQLIDQKKQQVSKTRNDRKQLVNLCRSIAQFVKSNPGYTEQIGKEFDITGTEVNHNTDKATPILKAQKTAQGWELTFGLQGYFNGVNIYRKRPGEESFSYLATDTRSPYIDNQLMENGTQYYACFILGDTEVGVQSDIVVIEV
jgi:hypothetical protein